MSKHTPGDWHWEEGTQSITKEWNGGTHTIAQVKSAFLSWHENSQSASIEAGANARLIAAAPELLDALETVLADLRLRGEMCNDGIVELNLGNSALFAATSAIAKATGKDTP